MSRIFGYVLPQDKTIQIALTQIFGIGKKLSLNILKQFDIEPFIKLENLSENILTPLYTYLEDQCIFEAKLKKIINNNIDRLKVIKSYRGYRHINNLPTRGQRTRTNAQTAKKRNTSAKTKKTKKIWKKKN